MNNEQIIEERFAYFWGLLINNPNQFFLIKKRQKGGTREERRKERNALIERLETSFKLMNLPYERRVNKLRAIVVKPNPTMSGIIGSLNGFSFVSSETRSGRTTSISGRTDGCLMFIDEMKSYDESNPDAVSRIWDSLSPETHRLVTSGQVQHLVKAEVEAMGGFPSMGSLPQHTSLHSPTTTDIFPPRVKLITSATRDSAAIPNILR